MEQLIRPACWRHWPKPPRHEAGAGAIHCLVQAGPGALLVVPQMAVRGSRLKHGSKLALPASAGDHAGICDDATVGAGLQHFLVVVDVLNWFLKLLSLAAEDVDG